MAQELILIWDTQSIWYAEMTGTNTTSILKWHKGTITSLTPAQAIHSPGHAKMAQYNIMIM